MSDEMEQTFTFTWRIKNFSMCPVQMGQVVCSPFFRVATFKQSLWFLSLYPKGQRTRGSIGCYLNLKSLCMAISEFKVKFSLSVSSVEKITQGTFKRDSSWGFPDFVLVKDILNEKDKFLPNDTLTIKCVMKCKDRYNIRNIEENMNNLGLSPLCTYDNSFLEQCFIETTIPVQSRSFIWTIQDIKSLSFNSLLLQEVYSAVQEIPSFFIKLIKVAESPLIIEFKMHPEWPLGDLYIKGRISVIDDEEEVKYSAEDDYLFQSVLHDVWGFLPFIQLSDLEKDGYFESTDGKLHLKCDFNCSIDDFFHHSENQVWNPTSLNIKSPSPAKLFAVSSTKEDEHSVVTLKAGDQIFKAHRSVLESKSEIFKHDLKVKDTDGSVDITDVEPHIVAQMLDFLYFNTVEDLSWTDITKLYAAGAKYQIKRLMSHCCSILVSLISLSNVCGILDFADLHKDRRLLKRAQEFVEINSDSVLISKEWNDFMERSGTLAAKVLHKILIK